MARTDAEAIVANAHASSGDTDADAAAAAAVCTAAQAAAAVATAAALAPAAPASTTPSVFDPDAAGRRAAQFVRGYSRRCSLIESSHQEVITSP